MSIAFIVDVHVPRAVVVALRLRSIDVLTAQEDGSAELDDDRLLQRAAELGRVLVSQDKDLLREGSRWQKERKHFSGVIYAHQQLVGIGRMIDDLELIARATAPEEWRGRSSTCRSTERAGMSTGGPCPCR